MQKFALRFAGAPDDNLRRARDFRLVRLAQERGEGVRRFEVEVVVRAIKVGGHRGNEVRPILAIIGLAELDPGNFGDGIRLVRRLKWSAEQRAFRDWLRRMFRVDTGAAQEKQLSYAPRGRG